MNASTKSRKAIIFRLLFILLMILAVFAFFGMAEIAVRILLGDEINLQYTSAGLYKERFYSARTDGWMPNIDCLKIDFPDYEGGDLKKLYLYADGIHFSALGQRLIAEKVEEFLEQNK